jgi:hypothetical protein
MIAVRRHQTALIVAAIAVAALLLLALWIGSLRAALLSVTVG